MTTTCFGGQCWNVKCWSNQQLAAALRVAGVGPGDAADLVATSHPESGGCGVIQQGQPYGTTGWGAWQITPGNSESQFGTNGALLNLEPNAEAAAAKLKSQGLGAWTTFTSGAYRPFLGSAESAVSQVYGMSMSQVKKLAASAPGGGQQSNPQTTAFGGPFNPANWPQELLKAMGLKSFPDMAIRLGLIVLGGALVVVGLVVLAGRSATKLAVDIAVPEARAGMAESRRRGTIQERESARRETISHQEQERRESTRERGRQRTANP